MQSSENSLVFVHGGGTTGRGRPAETSHRMCVPSRVMFFSCRALGLERNSGTLGSVCCATAISARFTAGSADALAISSSWSGTGALESVSDTMLCDPLTCLMSVVNSAM